MRCIAGAVMTFVGILVSGINLAILFPNPDYDASWVKVALGAVVAIYGYYLSNR